MMKKYVFSILGLVWMISSEAQVFSPTDTIVLPQTKAAFGRVVDYNYDGYLDYLFFRYDSVNSTHISAFLAYGDTSLVDSLKLDFLSDVQFDLADVDNDSRPDLITNNLYPDTTLSVIYLQRDSLTFNTQIPVYDFLKCVQFVDLDHDGIKELIYQSKSDSLSIKKRVGRDWMDWRDSVDYGLVHSWAVYDYDGNGDLDLFTIGGSDTLNSQILIFKPDTLIAIDTAIMGIIADYLAPTDYNNDGITDLLNAGNIGGQFKIQILLKDSVYEVVSQDSIAGFELFCADLNSDGWVDIHLVGNVSDTLSFTTVLWSDRSGGFLAGDTSMVNGKVTAGFGDFDIDGDLDKIESWVLDSVHLLVKYENTTADINEAPEVVSEYYTFAIQSGFALAWELVGDDHTPDEAITYGVGIGRAFLKEDILSANFEPAWVFRYLPSPGNVGHRDQVVVKNIPAGQYAFKIQTIDNSLFYRSVPHIICDSSGDLGSGTDNSPCELLPIACGTQEVCEHLNFETRYVCSGDSILFTFEKQTPLFLASQGYLGKQTALVMFPQQNDTLYLANTTCNEPVGYVVSVVNKRDLLATRDTIVCEGTVLTFEVPGADSVYWYSDSGFLSDTSMWYQEVVQPGEIMVEAYFKQCAMWDTVSFLPSKPVLTGFDSAYTITKGNTVPLSLSDIYNYDWNPDTGIESANSSSPTIASRHSGSYIITGYDSLNCMNSDTVKVTVVDQGWVPDLFTPNGDGHNDVLKVYGMSNVTDFEFWIYSSNGNLIYHTTNITEASFAGWDGTQNGQPLPVGVYTWKVSGILDDHSAARLNGESSGTIYLVR